MSNGCELVEEKQVPRPEEEEPFLGYGHLAISIEASRLFFVTSLRQARERIESNKAASWVDRVILQRRSLSP